MSRQPTRPRSPDRRGRPPRRRAEPDAQVIYGVNPVRELLQAAPGSIEQLWLGVGTEAARVLGAEARARGVAIQSADRTTLDHLTGRGHHQGVAARTRPFAYAALETLLGAGPGLLVALDGIQDPQNLGAILRSAEVLGAGGLILPRDRAAPVTPAAIRASAGAALHLPVAQVPNLVRALEVAKAAGYWIVGLDGSGTSSFQDLPALERVVLVVGGEGGGSRRLVREGCDFRVRIEMRGRVGSLNASVAAGIGLFALAGGVRRRADPSGAPPGAVPGDPRKPRET